MRTLFTVLILLLGSILFIGCLLLFFIMVVKAPVLTIVFVIGTTISLMFWNEAEDLAEELLLKFRGE